jgi:hypothetical protein
MAKVVADAGCPWVLMHWRGHSREMAQLATYRDVVVDVCAELAARADAALAAAVIAATPDLAGRVGPVRDARTEHAAALDAEVARQAGTTTAPGTPPSTAAAARSGAATVDGLRRSVGAAADAAGQVAMTADARRVGLVASVAACCTTYAVALG